MEFFHGQGHIILNPYDNRSVKWNLFSEIEEPSDYANLAAALLPFSGSKEAGEWEKWAQDLLAVCLENWHKNDVGTTDEFIAKMATATNDQLAFLCRGKEASRLFEKGMEKILGGILQTLSNVIKDLRLVASGVGEPFSIRQWIREGTGSLWMPYMVKQIPSLKRLISCWTSLAVAEAMSLGESQTRRLWFVVDELDALGRITDLERALVRGGKFGICVALGFQTIAQVQGTYGKEIAAAIVETCNTMLFLRCNLSMADDGTAGFAARVIGDAETARVEMSNTQTEGKNGTTSTSMQVRQQVQKAVLPSEMSQLPKREGFMKTQGSLSWKRVRIAITKRSSVVPVFEPIRLKKLTGPSEPVETEDHSGSSDTQCPHDVPRTEPILNEEGYPRMSFPFPPRRAFDLTAELYGAEHPQRPPAPCLEGKDEDVNEQWKAYRTGWIDKVWPDFRQWWTNAPEEERYQKVMAALKLAGLKLAGFDAIPEDVWEQIRKLRPAEGNRPFLN